MSRSADIARKTNETDISLSLAIDGRGESQIETGIGFFDHMLDLFARHGLFDLRVQAVGDLQVDYHHTVEDIGIALGQATAKALGEKVGIVRYGAAYIPMDEALARVVIDLSGRPYLECQLPSGGQVAGGFPIQLVEEFARAFAVNARCNLHVEILYGRDSHHMIEAVFKGLGRALDQATRLDGRVKDVPSTKGVLA